MKTVYRHTPYTGLLNLLLIISIMSIPDFVLGQQIKINTSNTPAPKYPDVTVLPMDKRKEVLEAAEKLLNKYEEASKMKRTSDKTVTPEAIEQFIKLFNPTARIVKDFVEFPPSELISPKDYASGVFNRMNWNGVKVKINSATLLSIIDDPSGFYVVVVEIDKSMYNFITEKNVERNLNSGRILKQEVRIDVPKVDLANARIDRIQKSCKKKGDCPGEPEEITTYLGPTASVFLPLATTTHSPFWNNQHAGSTLKTMGTPGFSIGFDWMTNRWNPRTSASKKLFVTAGVGVSFLRMVTKMDAFSLSDFAASATDGSNQIDYLRTASSISVEEKWSLNMITVPIGIGYRVIKKTRTELFIQGRVLPSLVISRSGKISGTGIYDAAIDEADWRQLEQGASNPADWNDPDKLGPFFAGLQVPIQGEVSTEGASLLLAAQLSPVFYYHLTDDDPTWSLMIGVDLTYMFSPLVTHQNESSDILQFPDQTNPGVLRHYATASNAFVPGIRIGVHKRLTNRI